MFKGTPQEQYEAIFRWRDQDGDGKITKEELYHSLKHTMKAAQKMIDCSMPHLMQTKGVDGAKKLKTLVDSWNEETKLREFVEQLCATADQDSGGTITFQEFQAFVDKTPGWMDVFQQVQQAKK
eukprot:TRINITY_DN165_c0_g1_i2.p1 TRINITY_DN165_c0_g1~~TRINITY_DN165_c0_g1_i2.p1  ORF type:complete len:124 (-),score=29.82 TRINITY_DN165_c0_g1_i2:25-396(-)